MEIKKLLTPYNHNEGTIDRIMYIVIHYVGATGGAEANCRWYAGGSRGASAHYFVDFDGSVWQSVEDKDIAWHCGAKSYVHPECRNANSIGIEMCVRNNGSRMDTSHDWYFEDATVQSAIKLTRDLMDKYNISADHVIRHYDVTGKICPNPYVYNDGNHTWEQFKAAIATPQQSQPGWIQDDHGWWWKNADGSWPASEWKLIDHHWYLFGANGYLRTGWHRWNPDTKQVDPADGSGDWYYLEESGDLQGACWHGKADGSGALERWCV